MATPQSSEAQTSVPLAADVMSRLRGLWEVIAEDAERARSMRNAMAAFLVRLASAALLYLSQILIARWTGSHEYGIYVLAWTLVMLVGGLAHGGLNTTMIRMLPEYRERNELPLSRGLIAGSRWFTLLSGSIIAGVAAAGVFLAADRVPAHYVYPLVCAFLCVPAFAITELHDGLGRARAWMGAALVPPYLLRPILLLTVVALAIFAGAPRDATMVAAAAVAATYLTMGVQMALIDRRLSVGLPAGPRSFDFALWFKLSVPMLVIGISDMLLHHADIIVISIFLTPSDAGIYFAAAKTMSLMLYVHYAVGSAVANRLSALNAAGDSAGLKACIADAVRWTFWPSILAGGGILILGKPMLWLFGPQFADGYSVMFVLVAGFIVRAAFGPIEYVLNMLGCHRACATVLVVAAVTNIALNLSLVPVFGTIGAAIATAVTLAGASVANYIIARSKLAIDSSIWADPKFARQA